jgi:hypothetical protein
VKETGSRKGAQVSGTPALRRGCLRDQRVEQDRLIGIVSIGDVVKHRLMRESEALRDFIQTA